MKRMARVAVVAVVLGVAAIGGVRAAGAGTAVPEAVKTKVTALSGRADVRLRPAVRTQSPQSDPRRFYVDEDTKEQYVFEAPSGKLIQYQKAVVPNAEGDIGATAAKARGFSEAARLYNVDRLRKMVGHVQRWQGGDQEPEYRIEYREHVGSIPTHNIVLLTLTPDGVLKDFYGLDEDVSVSLEASVSATAATKKLAESFRLVKWASDQSELAVVRYPDLGQHLAWNVTIRTGDDDFGADFVGTVDAQSGDVLRSFVSER